MDRASDLVVRLEQIEQDLKKLKDRSDDEAAIRKKHLAGISDHLQQQLLEELDWTSDQRPTLKIERKKKLKR